ncbi:BgTH12-00152 [Blumeria graminis f. sp. triticale]|uniref:BgTH12-00152 n=1 Tax=Blumeria graminis f. sp. triticale TaxID=1689686 RepID=A0A9W4DB79_BLUGR|nr:BgTH12-00152 [Blumeria graminis f. sp. triticale]
MQISILFLAFLIMGLMSMPIRIHGVGILTHRNIGNKNSKMTKNPTSQIANNNESNRFLGEKNTDDVTSFSMMNSNFPVTKSDGSLSASPANPTRVMGGVEPPRKYAKRALVQAPSGFQLDGKHRFPYYNQRSIRRLNGLVNGHKILSTNRRLGRLSVHRKPHLPNRVKSSSP